MLHFLSRLLRPLPPSRNKVRLGRLLTKVLIHGSTNSVEEIPMRDGSRMYLDARSRTEGEPFWNGEFDRDEIDFFKICAEPGSTVFDVGANVGLITIPLARYLQDNAPNSCGSVYAFEPVAANFERLRKNIRLNDLDKFVKPFAIALGDEDGEIEMALETHGGATTGNAVMKKILDRAADHTISKARIIPLDSFVEAENINSVDFIKIDIEGAEVLFLQGGINFLSKCRPIIYGEFNSQFMPRFGHTFLDVVKIMKPLDYRIFAFAGRLQLVEVLKPQAGTGNVVLVPQEKCEELLRRVAAAG